MPVQPWSKAAEAPGSGVEVGLCDHLHLDDALVGERTDTGVTDARGGIPVPRRRARVLAPGDGGDPLLHLRDEGAPEAVVVVAGDRVAHSDAVPHNDGVLVAEAHGPLLGDRLTTDVVAELAVDEDLVVDAHAGLRLED